MQTHDAYARKDPAAIEAELLHERARLESSFAALRDRLSPDNLIGEAKSFFHNNIEDHLSAVDAAVRRNPAALALAGIGIAWLIFGRSQSSAGQPPVQARRPEPLSRWESEGGAPLTEPEWKDGEEEAWLAEAYSLRQRAIAAIGRLEQAARDSLAPAADVAKAKARIVADLAADLKRTMGNGLSSMTQAAQDRIIAAREAAWQARLSAQHMATESIDRHPLASGLVAMATGAAVGAALPISAAEDRLLGTERDRLLDHARRTWEEEKSRAAGIARSLMADVRGDMSHAGDRVADAAADLAAAHDQGPGHGDDFRASSPARH